MCNTRTSGHGWMQMDTKNTALPNGLPQPQWLYTSLLPWFYWIILCLCWTVVVVSQPLLLSLNSLWKHIIFAASFVCTLSLSFIVPWWSPLSEGQILFEIVWSWKAEPHISLWSYRQRNVSCPMACIGHTLVSRTSRAVLTSHCLQDLSVVSPCSKPWVYHLRAIHVLGVWSHACMYLC